MTRAFCQTYNTSETVLDIVKNMNEYLNKGGYGQQPQLSSSRMLTCKEHLSDWVR